MCLRVWLAFSDGLCDFELSRDFLTSTHVPRVYRNCLRRLDFPSTTPVAGGMGWDEVESFSQSDHVTSYKLKHFIVHSILKRHSVLNASFHFEYIILFVCIYVKVYSIQAM